MFLVDEVDVGCVDVYSPHSCTSWAQIGQCKDNADLMKKVCPATCKMCWK